jgi:hypothetical protein
VNSESVAKSVHQRLLNIRDKTGEQFNHLLMRYGMERLLYRIQTAGHGDRFVLKGAMLFSLWQDVPGRPTRDIDFLGFGDLTHNKLRVIFGDACDARVIDDGLRFDVDSIETDDIRGDQEYHGLLKAAICSTFERRKTPMYDEMPVAFTPKFFEDRSKETQWQAFLRRSSLTSFGLSLADVVEDLKGRLCPILCSRMEKP